MIQYYVLVLFSIPQSISVIFSEKSPVHFWDPKRPLLLLKQQWETSGKKRQTFECCHLLLYDILISCGPLRGFAGKSKSS